VIGPLRGETVEGKVIPVLNYAPRHEDVLEEWMYSSTHSLTLALDGGEGSASCLGCFTPRERSPSTHWTGGKAGPRATPDAVVKRKIPSPQDWKGLIIQFQFSSYCNLTSRHHKGNGKPIFLNIHLF